MKILEKLEGACGDHAEFLNCFFGWYWRRLWAHVAILDIVRAFISS